MAKSSDVVIDANGNKIVEPVFNGGTGSVGGRSAITR